MMSTAEGVGASKKRGRWCLAEITIEGREAWSTAHISHTTMKPQHGCLAAFDLNEWRKSALRLLTIATTLSQVSQPSYQDGL